MFYLKSTIVPLMMHVAICLQYSKYTLYRNVGMCSLLHCDVFGWCHRDNNISFDVVGNYIGLWGDASQSPAIKNVNVCKTCVGCDPSPSTHGPDSTSPSLPLQSQWGKGPKVKIETSTIVLPRTKATEHVQPSSSSRSDTCVRCIHCRPHLSGPGYVVAIHYNSSVVLVQVMSNKRVGDVVPCS